MTHLVLTWGYVALFFATFLAAMGIPTGSELVIGFAGAIASGHLVHDGHHHLNLILVIIVATIGELLGATVGYWIGRTGGRPLIQKVGRYVLLTEADVDRSERLFYRHGDSVVFFGRFIPFIRSFIGLAAGLSRMTVAKFVGYTGLATAIWCSGFAIAGNALGASWNKTLHKVSDIGYIAAALFVVTIAVLIVLRLKAIRSEKHLTDYEVFGDQTS